MCPLKIWIEHVSGCSSKDVVGERRNITWPSFHPSSRLTNKETRKWKSSLMEAFLSPLLIFKVFFSAHVPLPSPKYCNQRYTQAHLDTWKCHKEFCLCICFVGSSAGGIRSCRRWSRCCSISFRQSSPMRLPTSSTFALETTRSKLRYWYLRRAFCRWESLYAVAPEEPEGGLSSWSTTLVPRGLMICTGTEDFFSPAMIAAKWSTMGILKGYQARCAVYTIQKDSTKHHPDVLRFILMPLLTWANSR